MVKSVWSAFGSVALNNLNFFRGGVRPPYPFHLRRSLLTTLLTPEGHEGGGGGGGSFRPPLSRFFWLEIFVPWPIIKGFGTTVLCLLTHLLTLIKWRHDWWRHHNKSHNLCVDTKTQFFAKKRLFSPKHWWLYNGSYNFVIPIAKCCFLTKFEYEKNLKIWKSNMAATSNVIVAVVAM